MALLTCRSLLLLCYYLAVTYGIPTAGNAVDQAIVSEVTAAAVQAGGRDCSYNVSSETYKHPDRGLIHCNSTWPSFQCTPTDALETADKIGYYDNMCPVHQDCVVMKMMESCLQAGQEFFEHTVVQANISCSRVCKPPRPSQYCLANCEGFCACIRRGWSQKDDSATTGQQTPLPDNSTGTGSVNPDTSAGNGQSVWIIVITAVFVVALAAVTAILGLLVLRRCIRRAPTKPSTTAEHPEQLGMMAQDPINADEANPDQAAAQRDAAPAADDDGPAIPQHGSRDSWHDVAPTRGCPVHVQVVDCSSTGESIVHLMEDPPSGTGAVGTDGVLPRCCTCSDIDRGIP